MSWSYNNTLATLRDRVRFTIGDVNSNEPLFSDEEIDACLSHEQNDDLAAAYILVQSLAMRFAWRSDVAIGDVQESLSQIARQYQQHADRLERQLHMRDIGMNISVHGLDTVVTPVFQTAMFDNPVASVDDEVNGGLGNA
jgi:hypothetical protein